MLIIIVRATTKKIAQKFIGKKWLPLCVPYVCRECGKNNADNSSKSK